MQLPFRAREGLPQLAPLGPQSPPLRAGLAPQATVWCWKRCIVGGPPGVLGTAAATSAVPLKEYETVFSMLDLAAHTGLSGLSWLDNAEGVRACRAGEIAAEEQHWPKQ